MSRVRYKPVWTSVTARSSYRDGFREGIADAFGASVVSRTPDRPRLRFRMFTETHVLATLRDDAARVVDMSSRR